MKTKTEKTYYCMYLMHFDYGENIKYFVSCLQFTCDKSIYIQSYKEKKGNGIHYVRNISKTYPKRITDKMYDIKRTVYTLDDKHPEYIEVKTKIHTRKFENLDFYVFTDKELCKKHFLKEYTELFPDEVIKSNFEKILNINPNK